MMGQGSRFAFSFFFPDQIQIINCISIINMGTSSGTLQGIESLDATLSEIERKLNIIENAHVKIGSDQNDDVNNLFFIVH